MSGKHNILIIGDCMIDEYIICAHKRNSPEADVPLLNEIQRTNKLGGASNVAVNVNSLGSAAHIISVIGEDAFGKSLIKISDDLNLNGDYIIDKNRPTTLKSRFIDKDFTQFFRVDKEITDDLDNKIQEKLKLKVEEKLRQFSFGGLIIQDYNKGVLGEEMILFIQDICKKNKIKLFVDPKVNHFELLSHCYLFKPNIKECQSYLNIENSLSIDEILQKLNSRINASQNLVVTLGSNGIYYKNDAQENHLKGWPIDDADVSGAGDTVISALCHFDLNGLPIENIVYLANKAGALSCSKKGISSISLLELDDLA